MTFQRLEWAALVAVLVGKLLLAWAGGPHLQDDSGLYVWYADALLDPARDWRMLDGDWRAETSPLLLLRTVGYPLLAAGAKLLAGPDYGWILIFTQTIATWGVMLLAYRVAAFMTPSVALRLAFLGFLTVSQTLLFDLVVMTDSLYASLFLICCLVPLGACLGLWRLGAWGCVGLGVAWGYSIWIRDAGAYFVFAPLMPLAAYGWTQAGARGLRRLVPAGAFLVAALALHGAYLGWGELRVGRPIMSIVGQHNWLRPIFDMAAAGYARPFEDDHLISQIVREKNPPYRWPEHMMVLDVLRKEHNQDPLMIMDTVKSAYVHYVKSHPFAYMRIVFDKLMLDRVAFNLLNPPYTLNYFFQYGPLIGHRVEPGVRELSKALRHQGDLAAGALLLVIVAGRAASLAAFALFALGAPWRTYQALKNGGGDARLWTAAYCWVAFFAFSGLYALVHFEDRHLLPVVPLGLLGVLWAAERLRGAMGGRAPS